MPGPKIIQIGFNKCGTRSMFRFFRQNRIKSIHWSKGIVGRDMAINLTTGRKPFAGYEDFVFYSDLMGPVGLPVFEAQFHFRELHAAYPDALFILNTRSEDSWLRSRLRHPEFIRRFQRHYRLEADAEVEGLWRDQWRAHHAAVHAYFADRPQQLLVFDIEKEDGHALSTFVAPHYRTDPEKWGHVGKAEAQAA